jgi:hypothetical protein
MKGPIGYELSPLAEEGSQLVVDSFHPGDIRARRLLEILEVMDVEILSRGIALANSKSIELTRGSAAENPAKEGQELLPAPADGKTDPAEGAEK